MSIPVKSRKGQRTMSVLVSLFLALALVPAFAVAAYADPATTLYGDETISIDGEYQLDATATGLITVDANLTDVTIIGNGATSASTPNTNLNFVIKDGSTVTLRDVYIQNYSNAATANLNVIDIQGDATIVSEGTNIIDRNPPRATASDPSQDTSAAAIHVPYGKSVKFQGDDDSVFYLYKYISGTGIGANSAGHGGAGNTERSGAVTFDSGNWYIRGSLGSAVIGNDSAVDKGSDVTINGGTVYVVAMAMGAAIGGGDGAKGVDTYINGGKVLVFVDWGGPGFGSGLAGTGADVQGKLTINGGSLKVMAGANTNNPNDGKNPWGLSSWADGVTVKPIRSVITDGGNDSLELLKFDASLLSGLGTADFKVDGQLFYSGDLYNKKFVKPSTNTPFPPSTFADDYSDKDLYFFVKAGAQASGLSTAAVNSHTVTVNDTYSFIYNTSASGFVLDEASAPVLPWSLNIDTSWYNTTDTSFELTSAQQLAGFAAIVNGAAPGIAMDAFAGKTVKLGADVALNDHAVAKGDTTAHEWIPIGSYDTDIHTPGAAATYGFQGTFDGQGHNISNIYFERLGDFPDRQYAGLFGQVQANAVIKNVNVVSGFIESYRHTAGIVGLTSGTIGNPVVIENCFNGADTRGGGDRRRGTGGILGTSDGVGAVVTNCINAGNVTNWYGAAGGIVGATGNAPITIDSCLNVGKVVSLNGLVDGQGSPYGAVVIEGGLTTVNQNGSPLPTIINSYWLEGSCSTGVTQTGVGSVLEVETPSSNTDYLKSADFLTLINAGANPPVYVADTYGVNKGFPILATQFRDPQKASWQRLSGIDRFQTMKDIIVGSGAFTKADTDTVIVASGRNYPDALAATGLAGVANAPIVLTEPTTLSPEARDVIQTLEPTNIYVVGGILAINDDVLNALKGLVTDSTKVVRLAGVGRADTALAIYDKGQEIGSWGKTAIITNGQNYADALSISPYAYAEKAPVFLSDPINGLDVGSILELRVGLATGSITNIIIVGGDQAVPEKVITQLKIKPPLDVNTVVNRLFGGERYDTSAKIATFAEANSSKLNLHKIAIATGSDYPDALAGGAFAGKLGTVLLLVDDHEKGKAGIQSVVASNKQKIGYGHILGGTVWVNDDLKDALQNAAS